METENIPRPLPYVFGIVMLCIYFGMAFLLVFTPIFAEKFSPVMRWCFGGLFFAYGIFRAYRMVKSSREIIKSEEKETPTTTN